MLMRGRCQSICYARNIEFIVGLQVAKVLEFFKEVKAEALRVVWPSRREALMAMALVVVVSGLCGLFFLLVDSIIYKIIHFILGVGN